MTDYSEVIVGNRTYRVGKLIGKGGEGKIYATPDATDLALKIYSNLDIRDKEAKVKAMVRNRLADQSPMVTFPISTVKDKSGRFIGFVMKLVRDHKPLHELYAPGSRKTHFPHVDYRFLVRAASNLARAVASVHTTDCIIGDINHSGILFSKTATVMLIDADSFQFISNNQSYLCRVGVPEYTPPELQSRPFSGVPRTQNHDAFGLAVVIFQLLFMGRHPFIGRVEQDEMPQLGSSIQHFRYAYSGLPGAGIEQPPGTPKVKYFNRDIADLFLKAFSRDTASNRPTARQWVKALEKLEANLVQCRSNPYHYTPEGKHTCVWCDIEQKTRSKLFNTHIIGTLADNGSFDHTFELDLKAVKTRIADLTESMKTIMAIPAVQKGNPKPSRAAGITVGFQCLILISGFMMLPISVIGIWTAPSRSFLWIGMLVLGLIIDRLQTQISKINVRRFMKAATSAHVKWHRELHRWRIRNGINEFESRLIETISLVRELDTLEKDYEKEVQKYQSQQKAIRLDKYLSSFGIDIAAQLFWIGIGSTEVASLKAHGIRTALDIEHQAIAAVPGLGNRMTASLVNWKSDIEAGFKEKPAETYTDNREIAKIKEQFRKKSNPLAMELTNSLARLETMNTAIGLSTGHAEQALTHAYQQVERAVCDLKLLGVDRPTTPPVRFV